MLLKFSFNVQSQTEFRVRKLKNPIWLPFWKWHCWNSIALFPYTQLICYWSLDLIFRVKLKLHSGNWKIQYGRQAAILKVTLLKIKRRLSIHTGNLLLRFGLDIQCQTEVRIGKLKNPTWLSGGHLAVAQLTTNRLGTSPQKNVHMKFEIEYPKQSWVTLQKPCQLQIWDTEKKTNMAARRQLWKWHRWKSIDFLSYTQVMCQWSLDLILKAILK